MPDQLDELRPSTKWRLRTIVIILAVAALVGTIGFLMSTKPQLW